MKGRQVLTMSTRCRSAITKSFLFHEIPKAKTVSSRAYCRAQNDRVKYTYSVEFHIVQYRMQWQECALKLGFMRRTWYDLEPHSWGRASKKATRVTTSLLTLERKSPKRSSRKASEGNQERTAAFRSELEPEIEPNDSADSRPHHLTDVLQFSWSKSPRARTSSCAVSLKNNLDH